MEPVSILGLIATAGTIAGAITKTISFLSELRGQYTDADVRVRLLIKELSTIKSSLTQINDWAHFLDTSNNQAELRDALQVALDGVELAMGALAEEVQSLVHDTSATSRLEMGFRAKTKFAWNADVLKEHENRLRAQVSALQLLLQLRNGMPSIDSGVPYSQSNGHTVHQEGSKRSCSRPRTTVRSYKKWKKTR